MNKTPNGERLHIGIFGLANAGKSTFLNILTGQDVSIVSDIAGTTADPVYKPMELHGIGAVVFIDTAGFKDNSGELEKLRREKTDLTTEKVDIAIYLFSGINFEDEKAEYSILSKKVKNILSVRGKSDIENVEYDNKLKSFLKEPYISFSYKNPDRDKIFDAIRKILPTETKKTITGNLVKAKSKVVLVMPQDREAPEGRLILPQAQTIRELLDKDAVCVCISPGNIETVLSLFVPDLVITDSQVFKEVYDKIPHEIPLTSFSVLFAAYKGDSSYFKESLKAFEKIDDTSKILIAEACTHPPIEEDIGRVKIPAMIKKKYGNKIRFDFVRGNDFPDDLTSYTLVIHCGACMFNRTHVINRVKKAKEQNVPMTNYGMVIAYMQNIIDKVVFPV